MGGYRGVRMSRGWLVLLYWLMVGGPWWLGCSSDDNRVNLKPGTVVVRIGSVAPLTGPQSHLGKDNENGARLAIEEANRQNLMLGGHPAYFELESEDDAADPRTATVVAQRLADDGINGVVGHLNSGTTIPASRVYADEGIPQVSPSATNPKYTHQGFETAFRVMANDEQQGHALGYFTEATLRAHRVAIIDDATAYGQGLADEFARVVRQLGGQVVSREHTDDHSTDFLAILTRIKAESPDLLFFGGMDAQGGPLLKQMRGLRVPALFLTGDGGCSREFYRLAGIAAEDSYCSLPGVPLDRMSAGREFRRRFNARFGEIEDYAPYSYDAVNVMIAAMRQADSPLPSRYLPVLKHIHYTGVTSVISFDERGDLANAQVTLYRWHKGERVPVEHP